MIDTATIIAAITALVAAALGAFGFYRKGKGAERDKARLADAERAAMKREKADEARDIDDDLSPVERLRKAGQLRD